MFSPWEVRIKCWQRCLAGTECLVKWAPFPSLGQEQGAPPLWAERQHTLLLGVGERQGPASLPYLLQAEPWRERTQCQPSGDGPIGGVGGFPERLPDPETEQPRYPKRSGSPWSRA